MIQLPDGVVIREGELLARHSPWRIGGPCDAWVEVHSREGLLPALAYCRDRGWSRTVVGAATRTLFRDLGVAGAVLRLGAAFTGIEPAGGGDWCGAGLPLAVLAARRAGLAHLRYAPGSLGASLMTDGGWEGWVRRVRFVHRGGEREGDHDEVVARAGTLVVTEVLVANEGDGRPGPVDPWSWYAAESGVDVRAALQSVGDVRLRSWIIPACAPEVMVHLGGGTARDVQLLQRSIIDRVQRDQGLKLAERHRWVGRAG